MNKGFTLTELIVVIGIVAILGVIFTDFLIQSLRAENKVKVINQVKQNSQVVLDKLTNEIRQAKGVYCTDPDKNGVQSGPAGTNTLVLLLNDGTYLRFRFYPEVTTPTPSNGYIASDKLDLSNVSCSSAQSSPPTLSDTDKVNGVSLTYLTSGEFTSKIFKHTTQPGSTDLVTIKFAGRAGVSAGQAYEATVKEGGVISATTVQLRGWQ